MMVFSAMKRIKARIQQWFAPPIFVGDEIKTYQAELTHAVILVATGLIILSFIGSLLGRRISCTTQMVDILSLVACIIMYFIMRRGMIKFAGMGVIVLGIIFLTAGVASLGTVRTPSIVVYLLFVVLSGLLFEYRAVLITTMFCSLAVLGLIVTESMGALPTPDDHTNIMQWIIYTLFLGLSGGFTLFATRVTKQAFVRAKDELAERKLMEAELKKNEAHYRHITSTISDFAYMCLSRGESFGIEWLSGPVEQITGYTLEELKALRCWGNLVLDEDLHMFEQFVMDVAPGGTGSCELRIRHKDGGIRWINSFAECVGDEGGRRLYGALVDITERKVVEEQLRESEDLFKYVFDHSVVGMSITRLSGEVNVNNAFCNMVGYSPEEFGKRKWQEITHPEDIDLTQREINALLSGEKIATRFTKRFIHKNGSVVWADLSSSLRQDRDGKPLYLVSVLVDITDRKQMEEALRESREMYRLLAENISDVIWIFDINDGRTRYISPSVERLRGYTAEEVMGQKMSSSLVPASLEYVQNNMNSRIKAFQDDYRGFYVDELEQLCKDGSTVWTEITTTYHINEANGHLEMYGVSRNISERKRAEQALLESREFIQSINNSLVSGMVYQVHRLRDGTRKFTYLSDSVRHMYGIAPQQGMEDPDLIYGRVHEDDKLRVLQEEEQAHQTLSVFRAEIRVINPDGSIRWSSFVSNPRVLEDGTTCWSGIELDVTERKRNEKLMSEINEQLHIRVEEIEKLQVELREQAIRDSLTGLYNRRYMQDAFAREFSRAMREKYPISIIMLDMDELKSVNDSYGHHVGDRAIQTLASCLHSMVRAEDIVCRYGGDEFTVILSRTGKDDALKRVEEWRIFLADHPMPIDAENSIEVKFTAGLASFPVHGFTMEEMIHYTDVALYRAKARGRNCTVVFE